MNKEIGEIALKIQRVGINFTECQNIRKIANINKTLAKKSTPMKERFDKLAFKDIAFFKNIMNTRPIAPTPIEGTNKFLSCDSGGNI